MGNVLVWCFDPHGKDWPYRRGALSDSGLQVYEIAGSQGALPIPYRDCQCEQGLIRVEYFHDLDPDRPTAYSLYCERMARLDAELRAGMWRTVVVDSLTFMELAARKREEKILNPMTKFAKNTDTRQWFAGSTDALEEMVVMRLGALPVNVVVVCHIDERRNEVSGEILRGPFAPGRLSKRGLLCAAFQEQYHLITRRDERGNRVYMMQTRNDGQWHATTQIDAPDPCYPHYLSIWENYDKQKGGGGDRPAGHFLVYSETGTGKSTFAASFVYAP